MEESKTSIEENLRNEIEKLKQENKELLQSRDMYEEWWRKSDARNQELAEVVKSISTMANFVYKSTH